MEAAANRVKRQAESLGIFEKVIAFTNVDLTTSCPKVYSQYSEYLNPSHKGFGYFSWKIEIVCRAMQGDFGVFDGVIWVDAGCEIYNSRIAKTRLKAWMRSALRKGSFFFSLDTPESNFTKRLTFSEFPNLDPNDNSPQIQATWFLLSGETGKHLAEKWLQMALKGIEFLDLSLSPGGERDGFIEHRFDQSLLSLLIKNLNIQTRRYTPKGLPTTFPSFVHGKLHPIWTARNRTGDSLIRNRKIS